MRGIVVVAMLVVLVTSGPGPGDDRALGAAAAPPASVSVANGAVRPTENQLATIGAAPRSHQAFLPLVGSAAGSGDPAPAVGQLNAARALAGVPAVQLLAPVRAAAQHHVNYTEANYQDSAAWADGEPGHTEVPGFPDFTGARFTDRISNAGGVWYRWAGEVIAYRADPSESVDLWMGAIYHRLVVLDPRASAVGFGDGAGGLPVDVMDLTDSPVAPADGVFVYPADGQAGVPTSYSGGETPDPRPAGVTGPVGYPISLQTAGGSLTVTGFALLDGNGQPVPCYLVPNLPATAYAVLPQQPLASQARYTVRASGTLNAAPFQRAWSFTTRSP